VKKILVMASMMMLGVSGAWAAGTAAGTDVTNDANLTFSVGGVVQATTVTSNVDTFVVDRKIDMALSQANGADQVDVVPGLQDANTTWQFRNEGNADQNFTFGASNLSSGTDVFGKTDNADTETDYKYYWDNGGVWTEITGPLEVAVDTNITIRVAADIPSDAASDAVMNIELNATAVDSSGNPEEASAGADNKTGVDIVLAEADSFGNDANNGVITARNGYEVVTAVLDLTKLSCVISDPVNTGTSTSPNASAKRIPGATIRYMFDINNTGSNDATGITIRDQLPEEFTNDGAATAGGSLLGTRDVRKEESQTSACACLTRPGTAVPTGDITESGRDISIGNINVNQPSGGNPSHTCVSFEVDIY